MKFKILFEDNHIIVIEKPVNIPVQQDASEDMDLLTMVKEDIKVRYNKPGNVYLGLVHRLDRPVGGAILFAKTSKAAARLSDLLRKREISREYLAVVRGHVKEREDVLTHFLVKDSMKNKVTAVSEAHKAAKKAVLSYELIERFHSPNLTFLKVKLQTGRSHQIRVQFKEIGHPLYGDQKYGAKINKVGEQIALWSHRLSFVHPVRGNEIEVISNPPNVFPWIKNH